MEPKRNTRSTKLSKWAESATDSQWDALIADIENCSNTEDGDEKFTEKYGFSISGVKPYLEIHKAEVRIRAEYEQKMKENLESRKESSLELKYKKPATPYRKVTLTLTEASYNSLVETSEQLADEYGFEKRYIISFLIEKICDMYSNK